MVPRLPVGPESLLDPEKIKIMVEEKNALVFTFIDPDSPMRDKDLFDIRELQRLILNEQKIVKRKKLMIFASL